MFDGEGFVRGVLRKGCTLARRACRWSSDRGGVGSAIAASLAAAGVAEIGLFDARAESARGARRAAATSSYPDARGATGSNDPAGYDVVVNATPMGMNDGRSDADGRVADRAATPSSARW